MKNFESGQPQTENTSSEQEVSAEKNETLINAETEKQEQSEGVEKAMNALVRRSEQTHDMTESLGGAEGFAEKMKGMSPEEIKTLSDKIDPKKKDGMGKLSRFLVVALMGFATLNSAKADGTLVELDGDLSVVHKQQTEQVYFEHDNGNGSKTLVDAHGKYAGTEYQTTNGTHYSVHRDTGSGQQFIGYVSHGGGVVAQ